MARIQCVDAVRKPAEMKPPDLEGIEGRWLDVPRLQQRSTEARSNFWCGRAAAAMIYDYYCKAKGKTDEYVGHDEGERAPASTGRSSTSATSAVPTRGRSPASARTGTAIRKRS